MEKTKKLNRKSILFGMVCFTGAALSFIWGCGEHEKRIKAEAEAEADRRVNDKLIQQLTKRVVQQSYQNGRNAEKAYNK